MIMSYCMTTNKNIVSLSMIRYTEDKEIVEYLLFAMPELRRIDTCPPKW
jgi:hypothetical protein